MNLFPYIFLAWMAVGGGWLFIVNRRRPGILADIEADLERAPELIAEGERRDRRDRAATGHGLTRRHAIEYGFSRRIGATARRRRGARSGAAPPSTGRPSTRIRIGAGRCPGEVEAHGRGEVEEQEPMQVVHHAGTGHERIRRARSDERPEPEVREQPVGERRHDAVGGEHPRSAESSGRRKRSRPEADPGRREHLERQPRSHAAGDEGRSEEGEAPRTNPKPRPNTRADRTSRNHSGSNPSMPGLAIRRAEKHAARIPSSAIALASIAAFGQFGHHDGDQQRNERHEDPRCIAAVCGVCPGVLMDQKGPAESHDAERGRQREQEGASGGQAGWPGRVAPVLAAS